MAGPVILTMKEGVFFLRAYYLGFDRSGWIGLI